MKLFARAAAAAAVLISATAAAPVYAQAPIEGFADLVDRLSPAVVNIRTRQTVDAGLPPFPPGSPLERFNEYLQGPSSSSSSLGSGFVIDANGVIVTNDHVIQDADEIEVAFASGLSLNAEIVGRDPATDLAVLRVSHSAPLPHVDFGDSDAARVGNWVVAIGNPFGLGNSVSVGVVSARNRDIQSGAYDDFIQTDAAINRGNSGGPLFNLDGEVIGVNSAILSPSGGSVGIGFAIPADLAGTIVTQLLSYGETRRGWIGVGIQAVTEDIAESYGLDRPHGALISRVTEGGPADQAGIEPGDLILIYDGRSVRDDRALTRYVAETDIGRSVQIELLRERETITVTAVIDRLDEGDGAPVRVSEPPPADAGAVTTVLGFAVAPLTDELIRRYRISPDAEGVVITYVDPDSDAAGKVRAGDVIEEVAWERVTSADDAAERARVAAEGDLPVLLLVNRDGELIFHSIRPSTG